MYVYMYVRMLTAVYIRCCVAERQAIESAVEASLQECDVDIDGGNSGDEGETHRMSTVKAATATDSSSAATACSGSASSVAGNTAEGKQRASGKLTLSIYL